MFALALVALAAHADVVRHAIVVGVNEGSGGLEPLRYAEDDARRVAEVLVELGGFSAERVSVLYGPDAAELSDALAAHASLSDGGEDDLFLFYYSGHADGRGLRLGPETLPYPTLRRMVREIPAAVRIGVLDACQSGEITRIKGLEVAPAFATEQSLGAEGEAWLTATTGDEVAQESDTLRSSFFTHYLVSGLRGAADRDDGLVSLDEVYAYTYDRTVARTGGTVAGAQHPAYDFRLQGRGDLAVTDVRKAAAHLILPEELAGDVVVLRASDLQPMAEVHKPAGERLRIGLAPGTYLLRLRSGGEVRETRLGLTQGAQLEVRGLERLPAELASAKGKAEEEGAQSAGPVTSALASLDRTVDRAAAALDEHLDAVITPIGDMLRSASRGAMPPEPELLVLVATDFAGCPDPDAACEAQVPGEQAVADGRVEIRDAGGVLLAEGKLKAGKREGRWTWTLDTGARVAEGVFRDGLRVGTWTWWYADGTRRRRGSFEAGVKSGLWTDWYPNGRRHQQVTLREGVPQGRYIAWHANGIHAREGRVVDGKPDGPWVFWWDSGLRQAEGSYAAGVPEGRWTTWHATGERASVGRYEDGLAVGRWRTWWDNGQPHSRGRYAAGERDGRWKTWSRDGRPGSVSDTAPGPDEAALPFGPPAAPD